MMVSALVVGCGVGAVWGDGVAVGVVAGAVVVVVVGMRRMVVLVVGSGDEHVERHVAAGGFGVASGGQP